MIGGDDVLFGIRGMIIFLCVIVFIGLTTTVFTVRERDYSTGEVSNVSFKETIGIIIKNKNFILYLFGMMFFFIGFNNLRAIMNYYVEDIMGYGKKRKLLLLQHYYLEQQLYVSIQQINYLKNMDTERLCFIV